MPRKKKHIVSADVPAPIAAQSRAAAIAADVSVSLIIRAALEDWGSSRL
jgi:hypothetical protein